MGQAKLRAREIEQLKAQGPKPKPVRMEMRSFGAFYHDDQPDGIGVFLTSENEPAPGWTNATFFILKDLVLDELKSCDDPAYRADKIAHCWESLKEATEMYNRHIFGTAHRQLHVQPMNVELSDELIEIFVSVITNIWCLELLGEITNDDYNGMVYDAIEIK